MKKLLLSVGIAAAILAGCNSSSSGGGIAPVPGPTVAPTAVPTATAVVTATPAPATATPTATPVGATPTPTATPVVTATPTTAPPTPSGNIILNLVASNFTPASVPPTLAPNTSLTVFNFTGVTVPQAATTGTTAPTTGPNETATLSASETNYVGTFSATTCTNAPPITVQPAATNPGQQNPASYTVTALTPGQCSIIVNDTLSHSSTILVNVPATLTATVT